MSNTLILSIETSCDETAIAILREKDKEIEVLTNQVSSQVKLHAKWGGVVPNLAAREHVKNFPRLLEMALIEAKIKPSQLDAIALTNGPGLIPALLVGTNYARTLSYLWEKPLLGIHHIEGHIYANFISKQNSNIQFPAIVLVVSGGHTQIVLMKDHLKYEIIGQTLDDAVGEAFDKVARILGIGYPGGPIVSKFAEKFQLKNNVSQKESKRNQNGSYRTHETKYQIQFPRPMLNKNNFNFSFSGLKTAVLYETKKNPTLLKSKDYIAEICHEFQQACTDVLIAKTIKAAQLHSARTIMLAGGVSANKQLRNELEEKIKQTLPAVFYSVPELSYTGDNAAMIGAAAIFRFKKMSQDQKKKALDGWKNIQANANLKLK